MTRRRVDRLAAYVVIIAILLGGWLFVVSPRLTSTDALGLQKQVMATNATTELAKLQKLKNQYLNLSVLQEQLKELQVQFPTQPTVAVFVGAVGEAANDTQTTVTSVIPGAPTAYVPVAAAATAPPTATATATAPATTAPATTAPAATAPATTAPVTTAPTIKAPAAGELYTIPISITASGTPAGTSAFIETLQRANRLFIVNTIGTSTGASGRAVVSITGYIFVVLLPAAAR